MDLQLGPRGSWGLHLSLTSYVAFRQNKSLSSHLSHRVKLYLRVLEGSKEIRICWKMLAFIIDIFLTATPTMPHW